MFGFRPDGRKVIQGIDPMTRVTPYIMTSRADSQCYCTQYIDYDIINAYVRKKRAEGYRISTMSVILAAYVRTIAQFPALNRFVVGKTVYARNEMTVSFAIVKIKSAEDFLETTTKIHFHPTETVYDVAAKVEAVIEANKRAENSNATDKVAGALLAVPGLIGLGVAILKGLDRIGWMPRAIIEASPFHTSLFITNMASIGMNELSHHLYNFGTTTVFLGLGKKEPRLVVQKDKTVGYKYYYPVAVTTDERVAPGAVYSMAFDYLDKVLRDPSVLELPPETVNYDHRASYAPNGK